MGISIESILVCVEPAQRVLIAVGLGIEACILLMAEGDACTWLTGSACFVAVTTDGFDLVAFQFTLAAG